MMIENNSVVIAEENCVVEIEAVELNADVYNNCCKIVQLG